MEYLKKNGEALLYVLPAALLVTVFFISSVIYTFAISFTDWNGLTAAHWVGLKNYIEIFSDVTYVTSLKNTFIWVVISLVFPVGLGLLLSVLLQKLKGQRFF